MQQCRRCILGEADRIKISFDSEGICSLCRSWERRWNLFCATGSRAIEQRDALVKKIRQAGKGKPYDSVMGVSGGVDSSYLTLKAKELGLRPLLVHFDNGWDSELAVKNIENLCRVTGFDLHTLVVDWEEFRDLQLAYLKASVIDIEIPTDHAMVATLYRSAAQFGVKHILSGYNIATEGVLPVEWRWSKLDLANLEAIHAEYAKIPIRTFPTLSFWRLLYYQHLHGIKTVQLLNYLEYNYNAAKAEIEQKVGWRDYGGKHCESIFTRFYQRYLLPKKFAVDKRKAHLSCLINSGQMSREAALEELQKPAYPEAMFRQDRTFVIKKFGLNESEFEQILAMPVRSHLDFPTYEKTYYRYHEQFFKTLEPLRRCFPWHRRKTPAVGY